ncbi:type III-B CRISPR module-associated Cmr3 family protein [Desulfobacter postgatei]|jgi:CRISPR-associated protein Cmr3|uniref:CRISPR-associated protein n=1 Tax=Desulfobacter postgatei 2ac9 TaxID=879212 RepID=I5B4K4_9BACT|nr:type III-B CRISPR module-associated Cmr3 family protein [Desulfobacter postgatei]EIM64417.1 CRISPR-associated protein [Desulfobacter postgatei 2ac9]MDX9962735.1 type III-B CRISPR module-associated Cmr3 family protein [Desulfobacter postgatei]
MNFTITSSDPLIFRDGRPFGEQGHVHGGALRWPWPSTISGLIRTKIGEQRAKDYFTGPDRLKNIEMIRKVRNCCLPLWRNALGQDWQPLFPAPVDAFCFQEKNQNSNELNIIPFSYQAADETGGTDFNVSNWMIPIREVNSKPAKSKPDLWFKDVFLYWLKHGKLEKRLWQAENLGLSWPQLELRIHTAISAHTGTADHGRLFSSQGIRLESGGQAERPGYFAIGIQVNGIESNDHLKGSCHLGGERRVAQIEPIRTFLPPCPDWLNNKKYLRLILASPGKFGGWAPDWMLPDEKNEFKTHPGSGIKVRLRSAHVERWQAVSGWEFEKHGPKAFSKLVPAGSVYILELKESSNSQTLAEELWGHSLNDDPDGFGLTFIGNISL